MTDVHFKICMTQFTSLCASNTCNPTKLPCDEFVVSVAVVCGDVLVVLLIVVVTISSGVDIEAVRLRLSGGDEVVG